MFAEVAVIHIIKQYAKKQDDEKMYEAVLFFHIFAKKKGISRCSASTTFR
jgi:hypothetical protein